MFHMQPKAICPPTVQILIYRAKPSHQRKTMIPRDEIQRIIDTYKDNTLTVGVLGSHSALDVTDGAKDEGLATVVVCQEGREKPYLIFKRLIDRLILLPKFADIIADGIQRELRKMNTIFIPHRAFTTYVTYQDIEERFMVPMFGNRALLRTEERVPGKNQYYLLEKAGIPHPKLLKPEEIDRPVMVKVPEMKRKIERAFFTATNYSDYKQKSEKRLKAGIISQSDLEKATIEELLIGTYFNFNYFYSPLDDQVEFMGVDRRLQTNINDFVSLPAKQQLDLDVQLQNIEVGHMAATVRESLLQKIFETGERFVGAVKKEFPPGPIGPFALQSVLTADLEIIVYDVSPRVPGNPILATTSPYTKYLHGKTMGTGRRIALELKKALEEGRLKEVVT